MKFLALALTLVGLQAQAAGNIQDYTEVQSARLSDSGLIQIHALATDLINTHTLSRHPSSCGEVLTFRGPTDPLSAKNLRVWIRGISAEMAALNQDEDMKLNPVKLNFKDINHKIILLADRNMQYFDVKGVNSLSTALMTEIQKDPKDYYFLFGDYLDGSTGWMTAVALVKLSRGEAILLANTNDCF